jgi:hypothetical protein
VPSFSIKAGVYTDTGYRARRNSFNRQDNWLLQEMSTADEFYDYVFFI